MDQQQLFDEIVKNGTTTTQTSLNLFNNTTRPLWGGTYVFWILWQLSLLVYPMFRYHWVHFKTTSVRFEDSPPSSTSMVSHPAPNELKGGGRGRIGEAADKEKGEHQLGEETSFVQAPSTTAEIVSQSVSRPSEDGQSRPISSQTTASSSTAGESSSSGGGVDDVIPDPAPVRPDSHKKPVATIMRRGSTAGNDDTGVSPSSLGYSGTSSWAKDPDNWDNVFRDAYLIFLSIVLVITVSEIEAKYSSQIILSWVVFGILFAWALVLKFSMYMDLILGVGWAALTIAIWAICF